MIKKISWHIVPGYCPQFDALFENLTGRETLRIFCLLRGIPSAVGNARALHLATSLGFLRHYDKKVGRNWLRQKDGTAMSLFCSTWRGIQSSEYKI